MVKGFEIRKNERFKAKYSPGRQKKGLLKGRFFRTSRPQYTMVPAGKVAISRHDPFATRNCPQSHAIAPCTLWRRTPVFQCSSGAHFEQGTKDC